MAAGGRFQAFEQVVSKSPFIQDRIDLRCWSWFGLRLAFWTARPLRLGRGFFIRRLGSFFANRLLSPRAIFRPAGGLISLGTTGATSASCGRCRPGSRFRIAAGFADFPVPTFESVPVIIFGLIGGDVGLRIFDWGRVLNDLFVGDRLDNLLSGCLTRCTGLAGRLGWRLVIIGRNIDLGELHDRGAFNRHADGSFNGSIVVIVVIEGIQQPRAKAIIRIVIARHTNPRCRLASLFHFGLNWLRLRNRLRLGRGLGFTLSCGFNSSCCCNRFRFWSIGQQIEVQTVQIVRVGDGATGRKVQAKKPLRQRLGSRVITGTGRIGLVHNPLKLARIKRKCKETTRFATAG